MAEIKWDSAEAYDEARRRLNRQLAGVVCSDHGQQAKVVGTGSSIDFEEPCCQKLTELTVERLRG